MDTKKIISRMFSILLIVMTLLTGALPVQAAPVTAPSLDVPATFGDVPAAHWAWSYIEGLYNAGITGGCSTSPLMYCPESTVTRAQMAIFILRGIYGKTYAPPTATGTVFTDVPLGSFAADWIEQLAVEGVTAGCGGGKYCPDATITRAQMAIFLLRAEHGSTYAPPVGTGAVFGDVPSGSFAADWIEQLATEGVTSGCGGGNYCPGANVTRAEMAVFLARTFKLPTGTLTPIIPSTTKILPQSTTQYLSSVSSDGIVFTFAQATPELSALAPGEIMVGDASTAAPYGFLRKVTSVSNSGGKVIIQTQPTTIEEAIQQGEVSVSQTLSMKNLEDATFAEGVQPMESSSASNSFTPIQLNNVVLYDADGNKNTTNDQVTANGSISFDPKLDFKLKVQDFQLKELYFTMTANEISKLKITSKVDVTTHVEKELAVYPLGPLFLEIGPLPVTVYPILTIVVGIDGTISASVSTGVTQTLTETAGVGYKSNNWSPIQQFSNQFQYDVPTLTTGLNFKGYISSKLKILFYGAVGPEISLNMYLKLEANPLQTPWWKLYGGLEVPVEISIKIFSHVIAGYKTIVIDYKIPLAQADGATAPLAATIAAGGSHTCAVTTDDGVKCWGENFYGQLGDGTNTDRPTPVDVSELTSGVTAITAGFFHTCALTSVGGVKCWGENFSGELGDGTTFNHPTPVNVSELTSGVMAIAAGQNHTCAVTTNGGVKCWGGNYYGQLGNGTVVNNSTPVNVSGLTSGVTAIVTGGAHTCVLTTAGSVKCWGSNIGGQLGDGTITDRLTPVNVSGLTSGVKAIAAGGTHTCALTVSGGVKCWGYNYYGQLGNGTTNENHVPVDVSGLTSGVTAIAAGGTNTCALTASGAAKCWGDNTYGQLGNGTTAESHVPVDVSGLTSGMKIVAAAYIHTCVLAVNGSIKCWGDNSFGQLGARAILYSLIPVDVVGFGP